MENLECDHDPLDILKGGLEDETRDQGDENSFYYVILANRGRRQIGRAVVTCP